MKLEKRKIKVDLKIGEEFLDIKQNTPNPLIEQLEEQIKLREMPIEKHAKKLLRK